MNYFIIIINKIAFRICMRDYMNKFIAELKANPTYDKLEIAKLKIRLCKEYKVKKIPTDIELLMQSTSEELSYLKTRLQTKPGRSISGVIPVAIMTSPAPCPHGKCTMCPGGVDSVFGDVPQSYTGAEPAAMRGARANYDPYLQVFNRLEQYIVTGHAIDKIDLIVMGGTFTARENSYQNEFITYAYKAMNDFSDEFHYDGKFLLDKFRDFFELPAVDLGSVERTFRIHAKLLNLKGQSTLEVEKLRNEKTIARCIGLTIETRPDWGLLLHGNRMLNQGCTRVELGIQSIYDKPLEAINRGHTVKESVESIRQLRDLGFKLNFHMMPGLPGMSQEQDIKMFKELFEDERFCPDMLKIYPLMVMAQTKLMKDFEEGKFIPITTQGASHVIAHAFKYIPEYCRVMRVQRDIPTYRTKGGVDKTNLRQYIDKVMLKEGIISRDIRSRETGRKKFVKEPTLIVREYKASQGKEFFISIEDKKLDSLAGFCRLRFPSQSLRSEITPTTAIIRELHVYGAATEIGKDANKSSQHKGFGAMLLKKAEEIAKENNFDKMVVISGVGVREYYRKHNYTNDGPYVSKKLEK